MTRTSKDMGTGYMCETTTSGTSDIIKLVKIVNPGIVVIIVIFVLMIVI